MWEEVARRVTALGGGIRLRQRVTAVAHTADKIAAVGLIDRRDVIDGKLDRVPKAYPAYFGTYGEFGEIRSYLDPFSNLYPVGRNGMHRYSNQDHSMLAANSGASSMISGGVEKREIWHINGEDSHHEEIGGPT
jgi:protoporphyrinogen oxidase